MRGTATVGIDFGSNNTCVYYNEDNKGATPVHFENYRSVLVGQENNDPKAIAEIMNCYSLRITLRIMDRQSHGFMSMIIAIIVIMNL